MNTPTTGVAWYAPETYEQIKLMSDDANGFFDTFDEWLAQAERQFPSDVISGVRIVRVKVDPSELLAFCRSKNAKVDARTRSEFAAHKVAQSDK